MTLRQAVGALWLPTSQDVTPSDKYIGWWPMSTWAGVVNALVAPTLTVSTAGVAINPSNWVAGVAAATWLTTGVPFKIRNTGTVPPGLSGGTIYYAGKPTADTVTFHLTEEDAIAGTGIVTITGVGTANLVFYPASIADRSGQGNDLLIGSANNDLTLWGTVPYMSGAVSASADTVLGRVPAATLASRFTWPTHSLFASFKARFGTLVPGRSFWGNGTSTADGPRLSVDGTDSSKVRFTMYYGGTGALNTSMTSSLSGVSETVEHTIALLLNGPARTATLWVDGVKDLAISDFTLAPVTALNMTQDLRIGGSANNNAHAFQGMDYHLLAFNGAPPANIGTLAALLAATRYARMSAGRV